MDSKKLNRIFRFIETEGGLNTQEYEYVLATINRMYIKRIIFQEGKADILGLSKGGFSQNTFKAPTVDDKSESDTL